MYNSYNYGDLYGDSYRLSTAASSSSADAVLAALGGVFAFFGIVALVLIVLEIIGLYKVFVKAGKPGWHAIIPFLNIYDLFEIGGQKGIYMLFMFIPVVGPAIYGVYAFLARYNLIRGFSQSKGFLVGLTIVPFIFYMILGFSKDAKYDASRLVDNDVVKQ